jgi:hypothetical protein
VSHLHVNAYIDEAGDEGFTRLGWRAKGVMEASSEWLILGAAVVPAERDAQHTDAVDRIRIAVGKTQTRRPLHWRDLRNDHAKKRRAMDVLASTAIVFSAVALWKPPLERAPGLGKKRGYLYNYAARFLVERLSWYASSQGRRVNLLFENRATTSYSALQQYVQAIERHPASSIRRHSLGDVRPVSASTKGAQIADYFVSATADALEPDLDGYTETEYFMRIRHRLYCPPGRELLKYGFKVYPNQAVDRHPWLRDL